MLNKDLCMKCKALYLDKDESLRDDPWDGFDDEAWDKDKRVSCPTKLRGKLLKDSSSTEEDPPEFCPFYIEQLMLAEKDETQ